MSEESARLASIRAMLAAIEPGDWRMASDKGGTFVEAVGQMGELSEIARFHPGATAEEMQFCVDAPAAMRFLLRLLDRCADRVRQLTGAAAPRRDNPPAGQPQPKDFAAEAAMKCQEPAFKAFLEERHGLERPLTDERVAQKVRSLCGVTSRRDLNDGGAAAEAWKKLRGDFDAWRRAGR